MTYQLLQRLIYILSAATLLLLGCESALASPFAFFTPAEKLGLTGLEPYQVIEVVFQGVPRQRKLSVNACGYAAVTNSAAWPLTYSSTITVGGTTTAVGVLPVGQISCKNGQLQGTPPAVLFRSGESPTVYVANQVPYSSVTVAYHDLSLRKQLKANACGVVYVSVAGYPQTQTVSFFNAAGVSLFYGSGLGGARVPAPLCNNGVLYVPPQFPGYPNFNAGPVEFQ
ncbi:hypothetical protein DO97_10900 [Neosynechococcus sphagnicola sy1]|uniref:Lipoprotein n=1 Tax=Neosynechococcus sphagnicola sy1 TaxID=1497020 RepID=A0A098TJE8_9CYAN|nr:hypothetical protein [Neosynechococcus sphagnicola]KGF72256.1 hypothetical protein DO97_10900 [Neosynechococcus sphagnicola sy1]